MAELLQRYRERLWVPVILVCVALFFVQCIWFASQNGPVFDEPYGIGGALAFARHGTVAVNVEHPPVQKFLVTIAFLVHALLWPESAPTIVPWVSLTLRLPNIFLSMGVLLVLVIWVRQLAGRTASVVAIALLAFDPTFVAHSSLVTPDATVTFFLFLLGFLLWQARRHGAVAEWLGIGLATGFAVGAKFSALLFLPVWVATWWPRAMAGRRWQAWLGRLVACAGAGAVLVILYRVEQVPLLWRGLDFQLEHAKQGHGGFLWGHYSQWGWWYYFPAAFAVKFTSAGLIGLSVALWQWWRNGRRFAGATFGLAVIGSFVLLGFSSVNIGIRYALPVWPFVYGWIGMGMAALIAYWPRRGRMLAVLLCGGQCVSALLIAPHGLAYANAFFGGPERLPYLLSDSNVDWGQDLYRLPQFMAERGVTDIRLAPFSSLPPSAFGIRYQLVPTCYQQEWVQTLAESTPQYLAISATALNGACLQRSDFQWLLERTPVARLGYSIYIYDITGDRSAHQALADLYARNNWASHRDAEALLAR